MTVRKVGFSNSYEVIVWANRGWLLQGSWAVISLMVLVIKNSPANAGDVREAGSIPRSRRCLEEGMTTHSLKNSHGQRSLAAYSHGVTESQTTE